MRAAAAALLVLAFCLPSAVATGVDETVDAGAASVRASAESRPFGQQLGTHTGASATLTLEDGTLAGAGASCTDHGSDGDCEFTHAGAAARADGQSRYVIFYNGHVYFCEGDSFVACTVVL